MFQGLGFGVLSSVSLAYGLLILQGLAQFSVGFMPAFPQGSKYLITYNHILSKILTYITTILKPST